MNKLFFALVLSTLLCTPCRADPFDVTVPTGLTLSMYGGATDGCPECGLGQGYVFFRFNEPINQSWYAACANQRFYMNTTGSGKLTFQALLLSQLTGKKVTRMVGITPNPTGYNVCVVNWMQFE